MEARDRRTFAMGQQVRQFNRKYPFQSTGYAAAEAGLDVQLDLGLGAAARQRSGFIDQHAGATRKAELVRTLRSVHVPHMARAGSSAAREDHNLAALFTLKPQTGTFAALVTAVGQMAEAAEERKSLLVKYGMEESVLTDTVKTLAEIQAATAQSDRGRAAHVSATAELRRAAREVIRLVGIMDGVNRLRFRADPALLAEWRSVSRIRRDGGPAPADDADVAADGGPVPGAVGSADGGTTGDVRPAA
jgi:hypothetical protein